MGLIPGGVGPQRLPRRAWRKHRERALILPSTLCFSATDVMSFLGRKFHGKFEGEVVTDQVDQALRGRLPGHRVTHRIKQHWLKMYDKARLVLRVETVIPRSAAAEGSGQPASGPAPRLRPRGEAPALRPIPDRSGPPVDNPVDWRGFQRGG